MGAAHLSKICGWIPMDHLLVVYIADDFVEENKANLYTYNDGYGAVYAAQRLVFWAWPGSDREKRVFDGIIKDISTLHAYKDTDGREWGFVTIKYTYGSDSAATYSTSGWVCLSDPASINIPAFYPAPQPTKWSPTGIYKWTHTELRSDIGKQQPQYLLSNIAKDRNYEPDRTFVDVPEHAWYKGAVSSAYEYAIFHGVGNDRFDPNGTLTVQNSIDIAARIHANYKYGNEQGDKWLDMYSDTYNQYYSHGYTHYYANIRYCESEGLIAYDEYGFEIFDYDTSYFQPVTRAEMIHIWSKILQPKDLIKQNTVLGLPDVDEDTPYYEDILSFYKAGIIGGVDARGTFNPDSHITRAEAAAIFLNLVDVSKRHSGRIYMK
jgi:hypothetical protein